MPGFGDKLRRERESRDTPLADVARRTRIGIQYLEALERGDFDGLPGRRGFGKLYIRVYAELFGFDPEPVISEYDQERLEQELLDEADPGVKRERPRGVRFVPPARKSSPSWKRRIAGWTVILVVLGALVVTLKMRASGPVAPPFPEPPAVTGSVTPSAQSRFERDDAEVGEDAAGPQDVPAPSDASRVKPPAPVPRDPPPDSAAPAEATPRPMYTRHLDISDFELGTGVVNHRLVDVRRDFEEGTIASFLTRVRGGAPGQTIYHAWIREGRLVQSIELRLGSSSWRTYSKKTLWGAGDWAVEAHDQNGRVLARIEFRCMPASGPGGGS